MDPLRSAAEKQADKAIRSGFGGWWARADENQKLAVAGLAVAAALGPLGQGLLAALGVLFSEAALPSAKQIEAVFWLFVITLPVAAWIGIGIVLAGRMAGGAVLILAGAGAYISGVAMGSLSIPRQLGDLYCYASLRPGGVHYEKACHDFDVLGFVSHTQGSVGSASKSVDIFKWSSIYVADARGEIMLLASIIAAVSLGYLIRRELDRA